MAPGRGVAGTILVHKIAGAKAEQGASLDEVVAVANKVIANVRTMGMAISPCIVPAAGKPGFELAEDEMEIGMGIHGEPGIHRTKLMKIDDVVSNIMEKILEDLPFEDGCEVAVLVNGLGGTPKEELYLAYRKLYQILSDKNISIHRKYIGEYATSLEMAGMSISLLKLDDELKEMIIDVLALEDISIEDIDTNAPLFGNGLGLDSIDALELGLALKKRYNIHLNAESQETKQHFASVQSLVDLVEAQRAA